jgi:hypothetical protein
MVTPVSVRKVENKADYKVFLEFPWVLYKGNPYWVPPPMSMQKHKLSKEENPTWKHLEGDYFVAWRGEKAVGTIAAFINHRHNEYHHENIGFFGLFEVYDDQEAASALLETASEYLRAKGVDAMRGPASFSTNEECGLLIENFDDSPLILMPYNYPYYQRLIESVSGFEKVMDLYSYHCSFDAVHSAKEHFAKLMRVTEKNNERRKIVIKGLDTKHIADELLKLKGIYNKAWENNWGFVPFSDLELEEMIKQLGQFFDPRMACFAEVDGKPVAFLAGLPDINQALLAAYPRPGKWEPISLLQILWHWKIRSKIKRIRIMLMGVQEGYRGIGVESAMFVYLYHSLYKLGWLYGDGGWVLETNLPMQRLVESFNSTVYKRYRWYERKLKN